MKPINPLLFLLLILCACADHQTELETSSLALRFGVERVEETRGTVATIGNIRSMAVFCAHTGNDFYDLTATCDWMYNARVTRTDENPEWTVQGEARNQWKDEGYHSFFAFSPHAPEGAVISDSNKQGAPTLTYTVPADYTRQVDLLYSHTTLINGKQMYIGSRPVVFGFRHGMAKITFEAATEADAQNLFFIEEISLRNIQSNGTIAFNLDAQSQQVIGANWTDINTSQNYSVFYDRGLQSKWLTNQMELISEKGTALFILPQDISLESQIIINYIINADNTNTRKSIELKLSDLLPAFQQGKAYRFSILLKEDKVTVNAEITDWFDESVDGSVPGTFLNVSNLSLRVAQGTSAEIYYATDGSPVTGKSDNIQLIHDEATNKFTFPSTAAAGSYIATITAGKLNQTVLVEVIPQYIQIGNLLWATGNLVADGPDKCKIGFPEDGGLYFQWGSLLGWSGGANGDGTGQPHILLPLSQVIKPAAYAGEARWIQGWKGYIVEDIPASGFGDPCRYYLKDGWRLPQTNDFAGFKPQGLDKPVNSHIGQWHGLDDNQRVWFEYAGSRNSNLFYNKYDWQGLYWSAEGDASRYYFFEPGEFTVGVEDLQDYGYPIRCVKAAN